MAARSLLSRVAIVALVWLAATPAIAAIWVKEYVIHWPLGDTESRLAARQAAVYDAKQRAASEVGSIVLRKKSLTEDKLRESIEVVSISLIRTKVTQERANVGADGRVTVQYAIRTEIDDTELDRQLEAMRVDQRKGEAIRRLAEQNARLRAQLEEARRSATGAADFIQAAELENLLIKVLSEIESNERGVRVWFAEGALLHQASSPMPDAAAIAMSRFNEILGHAETDVELGVAEPVKVPKSFSIGARDYADMVRVPVMVSWWLDASAAEKVMQPYFRSRVRWAEGVANSRGGTAMFGYCLERPLNTPEARQLKKALFEDGLAVEISVGQERRFILIAGATKDDASGNPYCLLTSGDAEKHNQKTTIYLYLTAEQAAVAREASVRLVWLSEMDPILAKARFSDRSFLDDRQARAYEPNIYDIAHRWLIPRGGRI